MSPEKDEEIDESDSSITRHFLQYCKLFQLKIKKLYLKPNKDISQMGSMISNYISFYSIFFIQI